MSLDSSSWIALAALALSIYSLWRQWRSAGVANFTVDWEAGGSLVLLNQGPGAARSLSAQPAGHTAHVVSTIKAAAYIGPGQVARMTVYFALGAERFEAVEVSWKDNRLRRQTRLITVPDLPQKPIQKPATDIEKAIHGIAEDAAKDVLSRNLPRNVRVN